MKHEIDASTIKMGMKFSAPVFFDDEKTMFITEEKPIGQFHLDAISKWNIQKLVTYGHVID